MPHLRGIVFIFVGILMVGDVQAQEVAWEATAVDTSVHVRSLFVAADGTVFAGTDGGLLRSTEEGDSWTTAGPVGINAFAEDQSGTLLTAGTQGVHRSENGEDSWTQVLPKPESDECLERFLQFVYVLFSSDGRAFAASVEEDLGSGGGGCKASGHLYRSDRGISWSRVPTGFPEPRAGILADTGTFYYGSNGGSIYRAKGFQWPGTYLETFSAAVTAFAESDAMLFAGTGLYTGDNEGAGRGIYRSRDGGETWQQVNTGLTDTTITDLAVYPNGTLLAATYRGGVHRSTDSGDTWQPINAGLPSLQVTALTLTDDGHVFAGTDQGIYRSVRAIGTDAGRPGEVPERVQLRANYPNPFSPQTTITYALPRPVEVRLSVYDVLGREVAVLVDDTRPAGQHTAVFEAGNLPSGVYLYRLEAGNTVWSGRMLRMK